MHCSSWLVTLKFDAVTKVVASLNKLSSAKFCMCLLARCFHIRLILCFGWPLCPCVAVPSACSNQTDMAIWLLSLHRPLQDLLVDELLLILRKVVLQWTVLGSLDCTSGSFWMILASTASKYSIIQNPLPNAASVWNFTVSELAVESIHS